MKRLLALLLPALLVFSGVARAGNVPALPGNSLVNTSSMNGLRTNLATSILSNEANQGSPDSTIVSANVVQQPTVQDLLLAKWTEAWTVQRKDKQVTYLVSFDGRGKARGISFKLGLK